MVAHRTRFPATSRSFVAMVRPVTIGEVARVVGAWLAEAPLPRTLAVFEDEAADWIRDVDGRPASLNDILNDYVHLRAQGAPRSPWRSRIPARKDKGEGEETV